MLVFYVGNKRSLSGKQTVINYSIYVVAVISIITSLIMFRESSNAIKKDILLSMQNTMTYNGFIPPIALITLVFLGGILGYGWYKIEDYVKNHKFK